MRGRIRNRTIPSIEVPVARERIRVLEVVLSVLVIAGPVWMFLRGVGAPAALVEAGLLVAFVSPPLLAVVALIGVVDDGIGVGSVVVAVLALVTLYVAFVSVYVLVDPPEGGGVYGGHLFTLAAGLVLAAGVLARTVVVAIRRSRASLR